MLQPLSATSRVMKIGLSSDSVSQIDMSMISYWTIRPRLLSVKGVANVAIWGEQLDMLTVQAVPAKMVEKGVALSAVMDAVSETLDDGLLQFNPGNFTGTGGFVDTPNQRLVIRHIPPVVGVEDLSHVTVPGRDGQLFPLTDVVELVNTHQPLIGEAVINDGPGVMLIVEKFPWANTLDVTRGVEDALEQLKPGLTGISVDHTIFRPASFIELALHNLSNALILGSVLVFVILILFLFEWRTALISLVAIPLSLMAAAMVLWVRDVTINTMVLAGFVISVGVVVDDAIIDVENITRRLRQARLEGSPRSTASIVLDSSLEVRSAIVYATLIDVIAVSPVFFISGLSGAFFQPLVISYGLAVLASLVVALTVTPALAFILLRNAPIERQRSPITKRLQDGYSRLIARMLRTTRPAFLTVGMVSFIGIALWPQLGQSLLPDFKERDFLMHWVTAPGTSVQEETRISIAACKELREIPGVRNCGSHIGQAFVADEPYGVEFGENWISVDPSVDYDKTHAAVLEVVNGYPGLRRDVQTYLKERIREVLTGSSDAVVIRIYGPDLGVLKDLADDVEERLESVAGIIDLHSEQLVDVPQIQVKVDLAKAQQYGVKPGDVRRIASTYVAGEEVGDIFNTGKAHDVVVWSVPESRGSISDVENLLIDTATGRQGPAQGDRGRRGRSDGRTRQPRADRSADPRRRERPRTGSRRGHHRRPGRLGHRPVPGGIPPRTARRVPGASEGAGPAAAVRYRGVHRRAAAAACVVRQHAAGDPLVPDPAIGARRRDPRGVAGIGRDLARRARGLLHGPRHRRSERDHDDQPLPASRAARGPGVRTGPRHPGRSRASRSDPDDRPRDRPRTRPAGHRRRSAGPRDRAPDGDRHPGRVGHLHPAQPVRGPGAVSAVRQAEAGPPAGRASA
jgi:Cu/Ag efflux pump CusA